MVEPEKNQADRNVSNVEERCQTAEDFVGWEILGFEVTVVSEPILGYVTMLEVRRRSFDLGRRKPIDTEFIDRWTDATEVARLLQ